MNRVLSREQIRALDAYAIEKCQVPSLMLMENAGRGAAEIIAERVGALGHEVVIVCGTGNNGGDGLVVARHLRAREIGVQVWIAGDPAKLSADTKTNFDAFVGTGGRVTVASDDSSRARLHETLSVANWIVDAVFGTGLDRPIGEPYSALIKAINDSCAYRFSLDIPSGIDADTGQVLGSAVVAHETVTFGALKAGLLTPAGAEHCGRLHVANLGFADSVIDSVGAVGKVISTVEVARCIEPRRAGTYKHASGHVVVFGGSSGRVGACLLAAEASLRGGAGLCTIASWPETSAVLSGRVLELMTAQLDPGNLAESISQVLDHKDIAVIGPGLGTDERARKLVDHVLWKWPGPKVVDADAITLLAGRADELKTVQGTIVLTPHPAELARLLGIATAQVNADRFASVRQAAGQTGAVVVLKGAHTLVCAPGRTTFVSATCEPALATAGSGDVLSGLLGALGCGLEPLASAIAGVHIHALAGERWAQAKRVDRGMLASEISAEIPHVISALLAEQSKPD